MSEDENIPAQVTEKIHEFVENLMEENKEHVRAVFVFGFYCGKCKDLHLACVAEDEDGSDIYGDRKACASVEHIMKVAKGQLGTNNNGDDGVDYHG